MLPFLPLRHTSPALRISWPQEEEVVYAKLVGKGWRQQQLCIWQGTANFWKLPWLCAVIPGCSTERGMDGAVWAHGPQSLRFLLYIFPHVAN